MECTGQSCLFKSISLFFSLIPNFCLANSGGSRGSPKTVKPPKYFRETVNPPQNSAKTRALHVPHRTAPVLCCRRLPRYHCMTQNKCHCHKKGKAKSNALNLLENVKISRMLANLHRTGQLFAAFIFNFVII